MNGELQRIRKTVQNTNGHFLEIAGFEIINSTRFPVIPFYGLDRRTLNGIRRGFTETRGEQSEAGLDRKGPNGARSRPGGDLGGGPDANPTLARR